MIVTTGFNVDLPRWLHDWLEPRRLPTLQSRMQLAIDLSRENFLQGSGGPFGAIVVSADDGALVAAGVNVVTSSCMSFTHAEMVALSLAQHRLKNWDLGSLGNFQLITSCEPCAMCFGALPWSGVSSLVTGARTKDAENVGFDEGPKPRTWMAKLNDRGIEVKRDVLRSAAAKVLQEYKDGGMPIYNPSKSSS